MEEFRGSLEAEATVRLKKALLDKDAEIRQRLEQEQQRVTAATTERVTGTVTAELEARFQETLKRETEALTDKFTRETEALTDKFTREAAALTQKFTSDADQASAKWKDERSQLVAEANRWRVLSEFQRKVGEASSQLEILRRFLRAAVHFANGAAVYLNKEDGLALWNAEGEAAAFPGVVSEDTIDPDWYFSKVVVRGKTVAAVGAAGVSDGDALGVMTDALKRAVENFGLRLRFLAGADGEASAPEPPRPAMEPEPAGTTDNADPRHLARTIISQIKTGHEKQVLEGRVNSDLYRRLQSEIEEARNEYLHQLSVPPDHDYFHEEVVKILADHVASRLGKDYPGPR